MKVKITNEQYKSLIENAIKDAAVLNEADKRVSDSYIEKFQKRIGDNIKNRLKTDTNLQAKADEIGINPNFNKSERMKSFNSLLTNNGISNEITDKVKKVVSILRPKTNENGSVDLVGIRNDASKGKYGMTFAEIMRVKDFIDSNDMRYLYDRSVDYSNKADKFGVTIGKEGFDDSNIDFNNINDNQFNSWYDSRKDSVPSAIAPMQMKAKIVDKYLQSVYGMGFEAPNFSLGNSKVTDALMINFTSAYRCPAWNECLVKHACYARVGETRHYDLAKVLNDKKNLMWEACQDDPQLTKMVYDMLKAYVVDWGKVSKEIKSAKIKGIGSISKISEMYFKDMPSELIDIVKQCKRVSYIRLNENGDFINQGLLDKIDELAGDFRIIDVKTAAYSCRNLKFDKIKNIIINASRIAMKGDAIARYFYAVPSKMYDAFQDTYVSRTMTNSFDSIGKVPQPLYSVDANGNKTFNGSYYYKCPCSREDFTLIGQNKTKENASVNCYQCHLCYEEMDEQIKSKLQNGGKLFVFVKAHGSFANVLDKERELQIIQTVGVPKDYKLGLRDNGNGYRNEFANEITDKYNGVHESKEIGAQMSPQDEAYNEITNNAIYSMNQKFNSMGGIKENYFTKAFNDLLI